MIRSISIFILAGFFEIAGGYLVWQWIKDGKPYYYGIGGALMLALYGIIATLHAANFAKVYAAYGGIFMVLSLIWAYKIDGYIPGKYEIIGTLVALAGVCIILIPSK